MTINVFGGGDSSGPVFPLQRSVRLRASASAYFNRTLTTPTSSTIWTWSAWVKRGALTGTYRLFGASTTTYLTFNSSDQLNLTLNGVSAATSTAVFRDPAAWYHIVYQQNGSAQTIYVNNASVATGTTAASIFNTAIAHQIGAANTTNYFDGYLTEVNFIDGQALTPTSFGSYNSTTGVWQPIKYIGTYGTNGFYLNFQDNSGATATTIGKDSSGNGNNWTPNNISVTAGATYDSMLDVPTNTGVDNANFATLNPLDKASSDATLINGNLTNSSGSAGNPKGSRSTIQLPSSGAFYAEFKTNANTSASVAAGLGICTSSFAMNATSGSGFTGVYSSAVSQITNNGTQVGSNQSLITSTDIWQIAVDITNSKLWIGRNNSWYDSSTGTTGNPSSGANPTVSINASGYYIYAQDWGVVMNVNFGQRPFSYTPPSGFKSLNTYNLPAPTIPKGSTNFNIALDTGANIKATGAALYTNYLEWIKDKVNSNNHQLIDTVRGSTTVLQSNTTSADTTYSAPSGNSVGWVWNGGSSTVTNTSGSISSQVNANTSGGFSIVTYTGTASAGATVGHGLNIKPSLIIVKQRTAASTTNWAVYHTILDSGDSTNSSYLLLNSANAKADVTTGDAETVFGNGTVWKSPTSSVFTIGANGIVNASSGTYISYCFSEIAGYSKFGSYTGNGTTDGPFVYCGFRPRWILVKASNSGTSSWEIIDTARNSFNEVTSTLRPNTNAGELVTTAFPDILSNGFKPRSANGYFNDSGNIYIFAAFAENPFNYSLAR